MGVKPALSKAQFDLEQVSADDKLNKLAQLNQLGLDTPIEGAKTSVFKAVPTRSFIQRNRRRGYSNIEEMKRWVGSSIDFNECQVEKVAVKPSRKLSKLAADAKTISVPDLIKSQYDS